MGVNVSSANLSESGDDVSGPSFIVARSVGMEGVPRFSELKLDELEEEEKGKENPLNKTE